jgi:hypothetical protein
MDLSSVRSTSADSTETQPARRVLKKELVPEHLRSRATAVTVCSPRGSNRWADGSPWSPSWARRVGWLAGRAPRAGRRPRGEVKQAKYREEERGFYKP